MSWVASAEGRKWDCVALGEVMLRLDPGEGRIHTARRFEVWEGGGEYNVARGLSRCFGLRTCLVSAFAENPVGRLLEGLILAGGVDMSHCRWREFDGVGREVRNGLNFTERGYGVRAALGCSDRGLSAASQMKAGEVDWDAVFGKEGARWFHTGGIFAALSESTPGVAREAMECARANGTTVSYDLNYRPSLWKSIGGQARAQETNRALAGLVDVMIGNEEDFAAALGFETEGTGLGLSELDPDAFARTMSRVFEAYPNLKAVATTLRTATNASENDWSAVLMTGGMVYTAPKRERMLILDRVGGGDSFASGLVYGFLEGKDPQWSVECGAAHGALAMTTPGDTSMATKDEVFKAMKGGTVRIER